MNIKDFLKVMLPSLVAIPLYAAMPQSGVYIGGLFGFTWSSPISNPIIIPFIERELQYNGFIAQLIQQIILDYRKSLSGRDFELDYSSFGQIGGQVGYRFNNLRLEAQFFYNTSPYRKLKLHGPFVDFNIAANNNLTNYITGETNTAAGMLNLYYDFFEIPIRFIDVTPFIGIGGGYANVTNDLKLYRSDVLLNSSSISPNGSHFAGQLMAGLLYFIDEFSTIGLDYRYFTTSPETVKIAGSDTTFRNQIQSVNLTYNGSFNFG